MIDGHVIAACVDGPARHSSRAVHLPLPQHRTLPQPRETKVSRKKMGKEKYVPRLQKNILNKLKMDQTEEHDLI